MFIPEGPEMGRTPIGDDGLPIRPKKEKRGLVSVQFGAEEWQKLMDLLKLWGEGQDRPLSISDGIRACVHRTHKAELGES
jgi:hypothetical protein